MFSGPAENEETFSLEEINHIYPNFFFFCKENFKHSGDIKEGKNPGTVSLDVGTVYLL